MPYSTCRILLLSLAFASASGQTLNFGSVSVGKTAPVQTLTYNFSNPATLSAVNILTLGATGLDYLDGGSSDCIGGTAYAAGQSCSVTVAFTPLAPGLRSGGVSLFAQGGDLPLITWYLRGIGQSGAVTIDPGTQSTIGTLSGNGQGSGLAIDGAGNLYVVDNANSQVIELAAGAFWQSTVVASGLSNPTAVALDGAGNLYISDTGNNRVEGVPNEQIGLNSADMSTVGISGLGSPLGLAVDGNGNLYVADVADGNVIEVPADGGVPLPVASGLTGPLAVAVDAAGDVYVASGNQVFEYPLGGGTPMPMGSGFNNPSSVTVDASGAVYVADSGNARIVRVAPGGASQATLALTGIGNPQGIAVDSADKLYVTDGGNLYEVNRTQAAALTFGNTSVGSASSPQTLTVADAGNQPLTVSNLEITANFTQVPTGGADCTSGTQLLSLGRCSIEVAFAPTMGGPITGALMLADNALNDAASAQTVPLSGIGTQGAQAITFPPIPNQTYGAGPLTLNATASSGLTVNYTASGPATVSANILTITGTGSVTVQASQAGNGTYAPALPVSQTFTVNPAATTVVWSNPAAITYGTPLSATQLNATATPVAAGAYFYTPPAGTVLSAGSQTLSVQFTPSNRNYAPSTGIVTLQVSLFSHVVIVDQENRTPDNLFGSNPGFEPGVDVATGGVNSHHKNVPFTSVPLEGCYDISHTHLSFQKAYNKGAMDGFDKEGVSKGAGCVPGANPQFRYVDNSNGAVQPYFDLATQYGFANRMFQSNQGPSFPSHQFLISGTSAPTASSTLFAAENTAGGAGCTAPPTATVQMINPSGVYSKMYPCFEHATLVDLLKGAGLTWRYYTANIVSIWTAPNAISTLCNAQKVKRKLICTGSTWANVIANPAQVLTDIQNCNLANVSWVTPAGQNSDHASRSTGGGPSWVASIVNAIGNSRCGYWRNTAILITWDDWGGWYDHVPPYRIGQSNGWGQSYTYGFRVPLLVVSPYTSAGYVSNTNHDFGSLLRFTEVNFGLGLIGPGTWADSYADDLLEFFPLTSPRSFDTIPSRFDADHFINNKEPATDPDDD